MPTNLPPPPHSGDPPTTVTNASASPDDQQNDDPMHSPSPKKNTRKRGRPPGSTAATPAFLLLLGRVNQLEKTVTKLVQSAAAKDVLIQAQTKTIEELEKSVANLLSTAVAHSPPAPPSADCRPSYAAVAACSSSVEAVRARLALAESCRAMEKKSFLAVIENVPDCKTDDQQEIDKSFINSLRALTPELPEPIDNFRVICRNSEIPSRPLKVKFESKSSRDLFIMNFSKALGKSPSRFSAKRPIRCRRDMTPDELTLLRQARQDAYQRNLKAGRIEFAVVRDFDVIKLKTPRDFRVSPSSAPASSPHA
ncbi:unnamed protein product [Caenorhabditis sp. 36 PRJEB53466]|nr:unnamed protein product [Caenorhabditis sp. 36 PRJEB53466]